MRRTTVLILISTSVAGCAGLRDSRCEGPGSPPVSIHYGDSELRATPPIRTVHRGGDFVLNLKPNKRRSDLVDYETVTVTVKGKAGADWIVETGTRYVDSRRIVFCVPADEPDGQQMYEISVDGVGVLDPRVDIRR